MIEAPGPVETPEPDRMAEFPRDARPWTDLIKDGLDHFRDWQERCDNIEKLYANLKTLAQIKPDREFQIFWANLEVLRPTIYSRPPVPVVMPRFRERRELVSKAAEVVERALISSFDMGDVDDALKHARDDLALCGRGAMWLRDEVKDDAGRGEIEAVAYDHVDRHDFLHEPARKWNEVNWVARRVFLTVEQGRERFGDEFLQAQFSERKAQDGTSYGSERKAEVWEIWHKGQNVVVWISPGLPDVLDAQEPFLTLDGFFPCPRPATSTLQRASMIPVPDFLYYRDQLEEVNELTARIAALTESLRMKGFYAAGDTELSTAIEKVWKERDQGSVLVPVSNMAGFAGGALKDAIVWLPVQEIALTIRELIAQRRQLIEDVYEISGLSDIMRGQSQASETATAQQFKAQYGSIRVRERQGEMVRLARDVTRIAGEIISENFAPKSLLEMSQVQLPTTADVQMMLAQAQQQASMTGQPMQPPGKMPVTIDQVDALLKEQRMRPFILEIQTDSTIQPDEDAEKQRRTEFLAAIGGFLQTALPMVQAVPESAAMVTEAIKFAAAGFRAGRQLETVIDEFAEAIKTKASAPPPQPPPDPAMMRVELDGQRAQAEMGMKQAEMQMAAQAKAAELQLRERELALKEQELALRAREAEVNAALKTQAMTEEYAIKREGMAQDAELSREAQSVEPMPNGDLPGPRSRKAAMGPLGDAIKALGEMMAQQSQAAEQRHAESLAAIAAGQEQMMRVMAAPQRVIRDNRGQIVGSAREIRMN